MDANTMAPLSIAPVLIDLVVIRYVTNAVLTPTLAGYASQHTASAEIDSDGCRPEDRIAPV